jgi:hypothetical protein
MNTDNDKTQLHKNINKFIYEHLDSLETEQIQAI